MGHLMWFEWDSLELFNDWHNALCLALKYPIMGFNQATGLPQPEAAWTTSYTTPYKVEGKIIAWAEIEDGDGLTPTDLRLPKIVFA